MARGHGHRGGHHHHHHHHGHHHGGRHGPPRVFPTHDPEGYPLPDANCQWPLGIVPCIFGLILIIAGSVTMSQVKASNRNWEAATGMAPLSSGDSFIAMIVVGAIFIALGGGCAVGCRYRNRQNFAEWVRDHPDAARAFEARGGFDAVPSIIHPAHQPQTTVQVIVVQSNPAAPEGPPGYSYPAAGPAGTAGAPIVQNGMLVYPQEQQQVQIQQQLPQQQMMTVVAAPTNTYYYKPEFRGQRLTPEQMAPAAVVMPQQQPTMLMVQPGAVVGQPVMMMGGGGGDNNATKPPEGYSYAPMPPTPAAAGIPGFGLPAM